MLPGTDAVVNPTPFDTVLFDTNDQRFKVYVGDNNWRVITAPFSNFSAEDEPTADNDITQGFVVGSLWIVPETSSIYLCSDNSVGAAVWTLATGGGGGGGSGMTSSNKTGSFTAHAGNRYFVTPSAPMSITYEDASNVGDIEILFDVVAYPVTILAQTGQKVAGYDSAALVVETDFVSIKTASNGGSNWLGSVSFR